MPFVSVIIPCYNAKEYITRTIDALENQTYEDFEIVFVDDCSTDGTHDFLKEYGEKEHKFAVQVGRTKQNSGPALARNLGISMAKGKYIAFCDSDDWYDNDFIEKMVCGVSSGADMVFCGHKKILLDGTVIAKTRFPESIHRDIDNVRRALTFDIDSLCCIMAKTTIISQTPQPDLRNGEDMAVIPLLMMKSKKFAVVDECLYNYLCRPGSASLSAGPKVVESIGKSFQHIYDNKIEGYEKEIEYIGIRNFVYGSLLNLFKYSKDKLKAVEIINSFEEKYPNWHKNAYIPQLRKSKRIFLIFAKMRFWGMLCILATIHKKLVEKS